MWCRWFVCSRHFRTGNNSYFLIMYIIVCCQAAWFVLLIEANSFIPQGAYGAFQCGILGTKSFQKNSKDIIPRKVYTYWFQAFLCTIILYLPNRHSCRQVEHWLRLSDFYHFPGVQVQRWKIRTAAVAAVTSRSSMELHPWCPSWRNAPNCMELLADLPKKTYLEMFHLGTLTASFLGIYKNLQLFWRCGVYICRGNAWKYCGVFVQPRPENLEAARVQMQKHFKVLGTTEGLCLIIQIYTVCFC